MNHHSRWDKHYSALVAYQKRYGDALVPSGHVEFTSSGEPINLGNWVSYMRTRYSQKALSEYRIQRLESVHSWQWGPIRPGPKSQETTIDRNNRIKQMRYNGDSFSKIAQEFGLSRQRIHQIIKESNES